MNHNQVKPFEYFLKPGFLVANQRDTLIRSVLGNCVTVTLFDRHRRFGGMNHFVFPYTNDRRQATAQYGNVAVTALIRMVNDMGASRSSLEAQILGGAEHRSVNDGQLGRQNVEIARKVLRKYNIPVVSEDVGGYMGRKVIYHSGTNEMVIIKSDTVRREDWFLPDEDLRFDRRSHQRASSR